MKHENDENEREIADITDVEIPRKLIQKLETEKGGLERVTVSRRGERGGEHFIGAIAVENHFKGGPDSPPEDDLRELAQEITKYCYYASREADAPVSCRVRFQNARYRRAGNQRAPLITLSGIRHPDIEDEDPDDPTPSIGDAIGGSFGQAISQLVQPMVNELLGHYKFLLHETNNRANNAQEQLQELMTLLAGGDRDRIANETMDKAINGLLHNIELRRSIEIDRASMDWIKERERKRVEGSTRLAEDFMSQFKQVAPLGAISLMSKVTGKPIDECAAIVGSVMQQPQEPQQPQPQPAAPQPQPPPPPPPPSPPPPRAPKPPSGTGLLGHTRAISSIMQPNQWTEINRSCSHEGAQKIRRWMSAETENECGDLLTQVIQDDKTLSVFLHTFSDWQAETVKSLLDNYKQWRVATEAKQPPPPPVSEPPSPAEPELDEDEDEDEDPEPTPKPKRKRSKRKTAKKKASKRRSRKDDD